MKIIEEINLDSTKFVPRRIATHIIVAYRNDHMNDREIVITLFNSPNTVEDFGYQVAIINRDNKADNFNCELTQYECQSLWKEMVTLLDK